MTIALAMLTAAACVALAVKLIASLIDLLDTNTADTILSLYARDMSRKMAELQTVIGTALLPALRRSTQAMVDFNKAFAAAREP